MSFINMLEEESQTQCSQHGPECPPRCPYKADVLYKNIKQGLTMVPGIVTILEGSEGDFTNFRLSNGNQVLVSSRNAGKVYPESMIIVAIYGETVRDKKDSMLCATVKQAIEFVREFSS